MATLKEYLLIKFVPQTNSEKRKPYVDCTRSQWVLLCPKKRCLVTKFMGPPYDEESNALLESLLKCKTDAPEDWPTYPIEVKGQADTYEEAMKKLARLEIEEFVFSTDSEVDPQKKALLIQNTLKTKKLSVTENTKQIMRSVPPMNIDPDENYDPESGTTDSSDSDTFNKNKKNKNKRSNTSKPNKNLYKKRKEENTTIPSITSEINNKIDELGSNATPTTSKVVKSKFSNKIGSPIDTAQKIYMEQSKPSNTSKNEENKDSVSGEKNQSKKKKSNRIDDLPLVLSALKGLSIDMAEVLANQRLILSHLGKTEASKEKFFTEKHKLNVPFQTEEEFFDFNILLNSDDGFRTDFTSSLTYLFDRELNLSKSLTNIFKKYLSRHIILKFTVKKKVAGKNLMNKTRFYECVSETVMQTHRRHDELGRTLTQDIISNVVGKVFNNAKDWEGERQKRAVRNKSPEPKEDHDGSGPEKPISDDEIEEQT